MDANSILQNEKQADTLSLTSFFSSSIFTHAMLKGALVKIDILNKGQKVQHDETKEFESCVFYKLKGFAYCNLSR